VKKVLFATVLVFAGFAFGLEDVLIHPGGVKATAAEYFLDGMVVLRVINGKPDTEYCYLTTDNGRSWENYGWNTSSDTGYTNLCSFAADGDSAFFYLLYDRYEERPHSLFLELDNRRCRFCTFVDITDWLNANYLAGTTDHGAPGHWIYLCVVDTEPPIPGEALMFLRSTDYGNDWFLPVDSYPLVVREPYLTSGAGRHIYFTGRAGSQGDSLIIWTNRNRLEPGNWHFDWIDTQGDEIECPIVAASFNPEDSLATVWCAYSRNRNNSGNWDIEFVYSLDGGMTWSEPQVLAGSPDAAERYFDLKSRRNPGAAEVAIAYISSIGSENIIYRRYANAAQPAVWSEPVRMNGVNAATGLRLRPKLCYLAGLPSAGAGVIYVGADSGGCWWSAHYPGVQEEPGRFRTTGSRLQVAPTVGAGPFRSAGAKPGDGVMIIDLSGRIVRKLIAADNGAVWDGRDEDGNYLPPGVYLVRLRSAGSQSRVILTR